MSEYSVGEVRAMASDLRGAPGTSMIGTHISLPTMRAVAIYAALCAYAERIKADERAVAMAWLAAGGSGRVIDAKAKDAGNRAAATGSATAIYSIPLFPRPPAQTAQGALKELAEEVEACWICASNGDGEITLETINNWAGRLAVLAAAPSPGESE